MTDEAIVEKNLFEPLPTREVGQRSTNLSDSYLTRFTPAWQRPIGWNTNMWRAWVMNQPVAIICRETLIANLLSLNWKITPKDMSLKTELDATIKHYTRLFEQGGNNPELELDYSSLVEWIAADLLDTPFGGVAEVGRKGDAENGRVMWLKPLDAATMYPTLNKDFPAVQYYNGVDAIPFPSHAIARTYMTPRPYMDRQGWGMAVPEKVYFALEMLSRGDKYYANLLLDIPTAGILDLGDMEKSSAEEWVESFKAFMGDSEQAFRIPVLYEHNNPVKFIPFGKVPNDIMFDNITMKYTAIVASAYGMTLNDIGLSSTGAGGTLAGTIRSDIKYNKTGFARGKSKIKYFFNQILPPTLQFNFIDYDYEMNVAMGRARLASATAFQTFAGLKAFSPQEIRNQAIADGLFTITIPDELPPESEFPVVPPPTTGAFGKPVVTGTQKKKVGKQTGSDKAGNPVASAKGGEGEFNARSLSDDKVLIAVQKMVEAMPHIVQYLSDAGEDDREIARLTLKSEPAILEYLSEIGNIAGDRDFADEIFGESLGILDEMGGLAVDNPSEILYDDMVETLFSRVHNSYQRKEE